MTDRIEARIAQRALELVLHPAGGDDPVVDFAGPEELLATFRDAVPIPVGAPASPATADELMEAVELVVRHSVHTSHPRFMNQNFAGADPIAVVGDWLGAALNTTAATFEAAPVFTLMEAAVLDRLAELVGYATGPGDGTVSAAPRGIFCPGGSTATLYALQLARHRRQPDLVRRGASAERLVLFVSDAGHYAATKSAALLGLGTDAVVKVATDDAGAIVPQALEDAVRSARRAGDVPFAVIATAGTTVTAAFDDIAAVADIAEAHSLWLHVDACYGGSALFSPRTAPLLDGAHRCDSLVWNLHKMMGITQQCTALLVRDAGALARCFAEGADYLFQPDKQHGAHDAGDRTFQCARRVDALKLWLAWKAHGDAGFAARIDHAVDMADHARAAIAASDGRFATVVPGTFTNVVFAWVPPDLRPLTLDRAGIEGLDPDRRDRLHRLPPAIKARMQHEGTAMVGFQPVHGINTFRLLVMNPAVTTDDIDAVLALIDDYGTLGLDPQARESPSDRRS